MRTGGQSASVRGSTTDTATRLSRNGRTAKALRAWRRSAKTLVLALMLALLIALVLSSYAAASETRCEQNDSLLAYGGPWHASHSKSASGGSFASVNTRGPMSRSSSPAPTSSGSLGPALTAASRT